MKVNLEFDDLEDALPHIKGSDYYCALWDFKQHLRDQLKYAELTDCQYDVYEKLQDIYIGILEEYNIRL